MKKASLLSQLGGLLVLLYGATAMAEEASITTDKEEYGRGEPVVVQYSNLPGNARDLITIVPADQSDFKFGREKEYTEGQAEGEMVFERLRPGQYEARVYFNYPAGGYTVQARHPFAILKTAAKAETKDEAEATPTGGDESVAPEEDIPDGPTVKPAKDVYLLNEPVEISFYHAPGKNKDWVTVVNSTENYTPQRLVGNWKYLRGKSDGKLYFTKIMETGEYDVRLYFEGVYGPDGGFEPQAVYRGLTIIDPPTRLKASKEAYEEGDKIIIEFSDMPGYKTDWIAVTEADSPDYEFDRSQPTWKMTDGKRNGEIVFDLKLEPNYYEARAYYNFPTGKFVVKARTPFTVGDVSNIGKGDSGDGEESDEEEEESGEEEEEFSFDF